MQSTGLSDRGGHRSWMPLYIGDFLADTMHLDRATAFSYVLLICHYWQHGGLPDDPKQLAQIARLSPRTWQKTASTLQAFFHDGWHHKRIDAELAKASAISEKRRDAVGKRRDRRSTIVHTRARVPQPHPHSEIQNKLPLSSPNLESESSSRTGAARPRAAKAFDDFWQSYPPRDGANPKAEAQKRFAAAVKAGADPAAIVTAVGHYAAEVRDKGQAGSRFVCQAKTWLGGERWRDYPPTPARQTPPQHREPYRAVPIHMSARNPNGNLRNHHRQDPRSNREALLPRGDDGDPRQRGQH